MKTTHARRCFWLASCVWALTACHDSAPASTAKSLSLQPEQQVNAYTENDQQQPEVARNRHGQSVVVWDSFLEDGSHLGVFGQRFLNGNKVGPAFQANTFTTNRQNFAAVGMDDAGNFVVAWRSSRQQGNGGTIFAQRFAADGSKAGSEFQVGPDTSDFDSQSEPTIAVNARGDFVIAWSSRELSNIVATAGVTSIETRRVQVRTYFADGSPRSDITDVVAAQLLSVIRAPAAAIDAEGNFVVAWVQDGGQGAGIKARRFLADGTADGAAITVNEPRGDAEFDRPAVAMNAAGDFVVAWETALLGVGTPDSTYYRRYSRAAAAGTEHRVGMVGKSGLSPLAQRPAVAIGPAGEVLVTAHTEDVLSAQLFDANGQAGAPVTLSNPAFAATFPAVALSDDGVASVVWQSFGQDGDGRGVVLRELAIR